MYGECEGFPFEIFYNIALFGLVIRLLEEIQPFTSWCRWFIPLFTVQGFIHQQYDDPCRWNGSSQDAEVQVGEKTGSLARSCTFVGRRPGPTNLFCRLPSHQSNSELSRTAKVVPVQTIGSVQNVHSQLLFASFREWFFDLHSPFISKVRFTKLPQYGWKRAAGVRGVVFGIFSKIELVHLVVDEGYIGPLCFFFTTVSYVKAKASWSSKISSLIFVAVLFSRMHILAVLVLGEWMYFLCGNQVCFVECRIGSISSLTCGPGAGSEG